MITFQIDSSSRTPVYMQIYSYIRSEIESGRIRPGEKLPSKRGLSAHMHVSIVTVENAYSQLLAEGYIYSKSGSGFYAEKYDFTEVPEEKRTEVHEKADVKYDFSSGIADTSLFPFSVWAKLSRATLNMKTTDLLNSCDFRGVAALREEIADYLHRFRGMNVSPDRIVVGSGSEYLLIMLIQLLGRDRAYGVENPGYRRVFNIFSANASRVFPVPADEKGAGVSAISGFGIDVIHITPSRQFPLGITMPVTRRREILQWAYSSSERYIIEDDCDCEFCYENRPAPPIQSLDSRDRVIYLNTFTRTLAPSIRIGYMVLPEHLAEKFSSRLGFYSCPVPVFEQYTLASFIKEGHFERHISRIRKTYRQRRDTLIRCIESSSFSDSVSISGRESGLHIIVKFNNGMTQNEIISLASEKGIKLHGLTEYYSFPVSDIPSGTVLIGFSGLSSEKIEEAAEEFV